MRELLEQSLIISLAIVGLRMVSSKGMILYFLREPFENLTGWKQYVMKPFILCTTCMASVWTIAISYSYYSISRYTIIQIFIVACLNSIIFAYYEKLNK